jgi:2-iminobutanoate/2-iminopropanoate deaminase
MLSYHTPNFIHPPFAAYVHGVSVPPGARYLFCSGQLGIDTDGTVPDDAGAQARQCFANIEAILGDAGMRFEHLVRLNAYVTDAADLKRYMAVRDAIVGTPPPASTLMIVAGFARPEFKVEIEVVAAGL